MASIMLATPFSSHRYSGINSITFNGGIRKIVSKCNTIRVRSIYVDDDDDGGLIDAPVQQGDGFSFVGGKYSDESGPVQEWLTKGTFVDAHTAEKLSSKARDPLFGLQLASTSQASGDLFRWFYMEAGSTLNPTVVLLHGLPSQSYSFRNVIPELSQDFHVVAPDWLGFGSSDKPQPGYGFEYSQSEYSAALSSFLSSLNLKGEKVSLVAQGYFSPAVVAYVADNRDKIDRLVLINPPITEEHSKLPSALSAFSTFLLGEIFAQDPLRASDRLLESCGAYSLDEVDAMVYRSPYLNSGAAGFALTAITRQLASNLKGSIGAIRKAVSSPEWDVPTSIIWGQKDRWLGFEGVLEFAKSAGIRVSQLAEVGHHAQEDFGEEVGKSIRLILRRSN